MVQSFLHYKSEEIYITAYSTEFPEKIKAQNHSINYYLDCIKNFISKNLKNNLIEEYTPAVDAMITGNTSEMSAEIQNNFRYSGISHLFAVSGFHLTLWTGCIYFLLKQLPFRIDKRIRSIISILFIIFFMALTGFSKSVVRAGIMQIIFFSAFFTKYKADPLNSLFAALTFILTINPFAVTSISLQMSFFATLGIITISGPLNETTGKISEKIPYGFISKPLSGLYTITVVSVIASIFTTFISAQNFGYYSVAGPLTNILCVTVAQFVMPLSITGILFSWFPPVEKPLSLICDVIMKYLFRVTDKISDSPYSVIDATTSEIRILIFALTIILILSLIIFSDKNKLIRISVISASVLFIAISLCAEISTANTHKITVADVGNGTSVVYNSGQKNIIIGCGGNNKKMYHMTNTMNMINSESIDLLIIPRNTDTESAYAHSLLKNYSYDNILVSLEDYPPEIELLLTENTISTSETKIKIDEKTDLLYINNDQFTGVRITASDFNCTVIFRATVDFSCVPVDWAQGNLLITRQSLPDIDLSGFDAVFISTNDPEPFEGENRFSTKTQGNLTYRTTMTRGDRIYAVK